MDSQMEICEYCGYEDEWNACEHWQCESCCKIFCNECFMEHTKEGFPPGLMEMYKDVLCPECFTEDNKLNPEDVSITLNVEKGSHLPRKLH